ncbi:MAG: zinc ribbon domain-containing protein [Carboxydocellales bacterium]|jgi:putative FmdB family regulatory protein
MPTYDFVCKECQHKFTVRVPIAERENVSCPQCKGVVRQSFLGAIAGFISGSKGKAPSSGSGGNCGSGGG